MYPKNGYKKGAIAIITTNHPEKMNAYNGEVVTLEAKYFEDFRDDPNLHVAILTGAGDKTFIAGADMSEMRPRKEGEPPPVPYPRGRIFHLRDIKIWKPIIAAINGYCLSGGLCHALECDIRIAAEHATFGLQQARFGVQSPASSQRLARMVGLSNALYLSLTGVRITAEEALRIGIIHKIVPLKDLMPAAFEMAETLLANVPTHVRARKEHLLRYFHLDYDDARALGGIIESQVPNEERQEGIRSFFEKRSLIGVTLSRRHRGL